jgi:FkbM family methyltransferase
MSFLHSFNRRVPLVFRLAAPLLVGAALYCLVFSGLAAFIKSRDPTVGCSWPRTASYGFDHLRYGILRGYYAVRVSLREFDARLNIERFSTGGRDFWIRREGDTKDGRALLCYLLAEHSWMAATNRSEHVRPGDVVFDCGAHIGVFTDMALRRGAAKVVAIEPDPVNLECLRRNFRSEIASGRVVVYPKGVWSSENVLDLFIGKGNSGMGSMVKDQHAGKIQVPVSTIDRIALELHIDRVNFIKLDIEGAEREALAGAKQTLARDFPRLMLDTYHRPDDVRVLPFVIGNANPRYRMKCGPCEESLVPHVTYYR